MTDNHGRAINYLRLAVTDKCNLRCFYCMPAEGIDFLPKKEVMSYEEMLRICSLLTENGIEKIRITGGEPFVRKDIMPFLHQLSSLPKLRQLTITTNGVLTAPLVHDLKKMGIRSINLSLDTLDRNRFFTITRRDELPAVMETLDQLLHYGIDVKINAVVMDGKNTEDIIPLVRLTKDLPVSVRFIEEMPFNGGDTYYPRLEWDHVKILEIIKTHFPSIKKLQDPPFSTSYNYQIEGHKGSIGIIAAYSRSFCGTCNRIRITANGMLKTCLYDNGVINIKSLMRNGYSDNDLLTHVKGAIDRRARNGFEAEQTRLHESMSSIGG